MKTLTNGQPRFSKINDLKITKAYKKWVEAEEPCS